jgi:TIR domain
MDGPAEAKAQLRPASRSSRSGGEPGERDFFISYSQLDHAWAEWIAWVLEEAGYSTILQAWDCLAGMDFVEFMLMARKNSKKTIAVLSEDYFSSDHCMTEYKDAYAADPSGRLRLLVPMRVTNCTPTLLQTWVYSDLFGKSEADARHAILEVFGTNPGAMGGADDRPFVEGRRKPGACPPFPGEVESRPAIEVDPLIPRPIEDQQFKILIRRLLNSFILLFSLGTFSVSVAYLLGSQLFQDNPEHAY